MPIMSSPLGPPAAFTVIVVPFAVVLPPAFVAVSRVFHDPTPNVLPVMVGFCDVLNCVHDPLPAVRYSHDHDVGELVQVPEENTKLSAVVPDDGEQDGATVLAGGSTDAIASNADVDHQLLPAIAHEVVRFPPPELRDTPPHMPVPGRS